MRAHQAWCDNSLLIFLLKYRHHEYSDTYRYFMYVNLRKSDEKLLTPAPLLKLVTRFKKEHYTQEHVPQQNPWHTKRCTRCKNEHVAAVFSRVITDRGTAPLAVLGTREKSRRFGRFAHTPHPPWGLLFVPILYPFNDQGIVVRTEGGIANAHAFVALSVRLGAVV